jgi:hypothetical protein
MADWNSDWVHDRYDDEEPSNARGGGGYSRPRGRRDDRATRDERYDDVRDRY